MTGHVVGAFGRMFEMRVTFRHQPIEPSFKVGPSGWIRIFHCDQAATRVLAKHNGYTSLQTGLGDDAGNVLGDFQQTLS